MLAALVACAVALQFTGASRPLELLDPGAVVRWGLPLTTVLNELCAAATVGLLLLGGMLMPEGKRSARRARTSRYAGRTAAGWAVTGAVEGMLSYTDISGVQMRLGSGTFWSGVWQSTWDIELLRAPAVTTVLAAIIAVIALSGAGRTAQAWLCALGVVAMLPLALVGHAAGSDDHDAAVNSLAFHLVGVALWVGGLLALTAMWGRLGKGAADVVARFSVLATWCYVAVGLSGLLNAWIRLGGFGGLGSKYGVVVLAKVAALVILGVLGWRQRQVVVAQLRADTASTPARSAFWRLAGVEAAVMAVAIGLGAALSRSQPPTASQTESGDRIFALTGYPRPPALTGSSWVTQWSIEWLFTTLAVVAIGVYLHWAWRLHRRGDRWPLARTVWWCSGWLIFLYLIDGAPGVYGRVMFSVHMLMHMGVAMLVPILLVRGGVVTLAMRALPVRHDGTLGPRELILAVVHSRIFAVFANPVVAAVLMLGTLIGFYYSPWFEQALTTHTGHVLMVTHFLLTGYIYAYSLVGIDPGPPRWPAPARMLVLLVTVAFHAFFGVALMTGNALLAPDFFRVLDLPWVPDPLVDQQKAGTIAWGAGELPTLLLAMLIAVQWYRNDQNEGRRAERQAERDGDAELRAYNDYLAARSKVSQGDRDA